MPRLFTVRACTFQKLLVILTLYSTADSVRLVAIYLFCALSPRSAPHLCQPHDVHDGAGMTLTSYGLQRF